MSFQVGIGSLGGTVFSGGTLYPSANYVNNKKIRVQKKRIKMEQLIIVKNINLSIFFIYI